MDSLATEGNLAVALTADAEGTFLDRPVTTTYFANNIQMIADLLRLYFPTGARVADVTYGQGVGSVAKMPFRGKIRKSCVGKSMTCESKLSCFR